MKFLSRVGELGLKKNKTVYALLRFFTNKRQKFIFSVILLSLGLFIAEYILGKSGMMLVLALSFLTSILLYFSLRADLKENFTPQIFILPFFYSLAIGLFFLLVPARFITRVGMTF